MNTDAEGRLHLVCVSGPDQGKRIGVGADQVVVGRAPDCDLRSDDPEVAERHAGLRLLNGGLRYWALDGSRTLLDGIEQGFGTLAPSQLLRIGGSCWRIEPRLPGMDAGGLFETVGRHVRTITETEELEGFNVQEFFSDVSKRRTDEDIEEFFIVGTRLTTPQLRDVDANWPKPWLFFKTLTLTLLIYFGFVFAFNTFHNPNLVPGLIMMGSVAVPVSVVFFFYEMNVLRNVSVYQVFKALLAGGLLSLVTSLYGFQVLNLDWLGASSAGIIEETGKLLALIILYRETKSRWILNGLLLGGAVGAGFAAFESAGYALRLLIVGGPEAMFEVIWVRGLLSPGAHVAWTALVGAALWRVRGDRPLSWEMLQDMRFLRVFGMVIGLHMLWNAPIPLPLFATQLALMVIAWMAILGFVQAGLKQVRKEQVDLAKPQDTTPV